MSTSRTWPTKSPPNTSCDLNTSLHNNNTNNNQNNNPNNNNQATTTNNQTVQSNQTTNTHNLKYNSSQSGTKHYLNNNNPNNHNDHNNNNNTPTLTLSQALNHRSLLNNRATTFLILEKFSKITWASHKCPWKTKSKGWSIVKCSKHNRGKLDKKIVGIRKMMRMIERR